MHPTDPTPEPRRVAPSSVLPCACAWTLLATVLAIQPGTAAAQGAPVEAIDLGTPSVLSQRGQRMRIAVPFGSTPGARVAATRFTVASVDVPGGFEALRAEDFVVLMPERRNIVLLQSKAPVAAPSASIELHVSGQPPMRLDVAIPPARFASDLGIGSMAVAATPSAANATAAAARRPPHRAARPDRGRNTATSS